MQERTPEEETLALMAEIWAEFKDEHLERLAVLEQAAASSPTGSLSGDLRWKARQEAHKLSGSLGSFGFAEASRLAKQIESLLEAEEPDDAALPGLVASLRVQLEIAARGA